MPIHPKQSRKLLSSGKASVFRRYPFTLILSKVVTDPVVHALILKIDPGSKFTGFALVTDRGEVVWRMQLKHRGSLISKNIQQRAMVRRNRRAKLRYRPARFLNRTKPKGWLAPSLMHRVLTVSTWVKRIMKFCPVSEVWIEQVKFDMQLMNNADIQGTEYQQGTLAGYTVREYLLEKWGRKCSYCSVDNKPLQLEHIHPKSKGGSNAVSNLCLSCDKCNKAKGTQDIEVFLKGKNDLLKRIKSQAKQPLKDAAAVNATRNKIVEAISKYATVKTFTGAQTKMNRIKLKLPKDHDVDAACVGDVDQLTFKSDKPLMVTCTGWGTRRRVRMNKYGFPCSKPRKIYDLPVKTGDIAKHPDGAVGKIVIQSSKGVEIRENGNRHRCKISDVKTMHRKDGYRYE